MNRQELVAVREYIANNVGTLSIAEMMNYYEMFMNGADKYLLGVEFDEMTYGIFVKNIPLKYCSCQTDHKAGVQYLRFRPHEWGAQEIATDKTAICFGSIDKVYSLYTCNTKQGYNSGYCFERAVYEKYGMADEWEQDNKASTKGGDITLNSEEVQIKFVGKNSLATITSTKKLSDRLTKF